MNVTIGKLRGLQRTTTEEGFFTLCAVDHLSDFQILINPDPSTVDYETTVTGKAKLIEAVKGAVSGFLLDPRYSYAQAIRSGALGGDLGLMVSLEEDGYLGSDTARRTNMRQSWGVRKAKLSGADAVKLLWFYRPESPYAAAQRDLVQGLVEQCRQWDIALVVEPIWHPLEGEDATTEAWKLRRIDGIVESGKLAVELGTDVLKTEFPGYVNGPGGQHRAAEALAEIGRAIEVPWVLLSAGVGFDEFCDQVVESGKAGASGYLVGRSVWSEAVKANGTATHATAIADATARLNRLSSLIREHGQPFLATEPATDVPDGWYQRYDEQEGASR